MNRLNLIIVSIFLMGSSFSRLPKENQLADLNLYFESDIKIDSVLVTNITQDREFHFVKFANAIHVDLNDSINDLYAINFFTAGKHKMVQLWLNGERLIIKGSVSDGIKIRVDTVIGSDQYYKSLNFRKRYKDLLAAKSDSSAINNFLFRELKQEIDKPFSMEIANNIVNRNINNTDELRKTFAILSTQSDLFKRHLINPYKTLETMLTINKINFSEYQFYDRSKRISTINLSGDKKYLIDFWFLACAPCIQDHKSIIQKLTALEGKNVEVIGVSIDNNHDQWAKYLNEKMYPWKNYREMDEHEKRMRTKMMINVFPTYLLLDSEGTILYRSNDFSSIEKYLAI